MAAIGHPIVGDAKYGGPEAFLTGGVSRKMHLHARRIRIDAPEGGKIDVTAPLPAHFAESLETLGFQEATGDRIPPPRPQPGFKAKRVTRDNRRGERRSRGGAPDKAKRR
jgi:23S rRNA pseudouridine955/2504/2580 synthase